MEINDIVNQFYRLFTGWLFDPLEILDRVLNTMYYTFYIRKKYGFIKRRIDSPNKELKTIQRLIYINILQKVPLPVCIHGFRKNHTIRSNAITHSGKNYIYTLDIKDFFPSITRRQVKDMFAGLRLIDDNAEIFSKLCTYKGVLPQGAVTSPAISNIVFSPIDIEILKLCSDKNVHYSRYADDLTFSGNDRKTLLDTVWVVKVLIIFRGFRINKHKNRLMSGKGAKIVTGLRLNSGKPSIGNRRKKMLRARIYNWLIYDNHDGIEYIYGSLAFLKSVEPETWLRFTSYIDSLKRNKKQIIQRRIARKKSGLGIE
jgi:retron-type reverse transcriptase